MPVRIEREEIVTVKDDVGVVVQPGDFIMIRAGKQDVVCRFKGIEHGYFKTQHLYDDETIKYRSSSINGIIHIDIVTIKPEPTGDGAVEEA